VGAVNEVDAVAGGWTRICLGRKGRDSLCFQVEKRNVELVEIVMRKKILKSGVLRFQLGGAIEAPRRDWGMMG
jgi:hypothetical protein